MKDVKLSPKPSNVLLSPKNETLLLYCTENNSTFKVLASYTNTLSVFLEMPKIMFELLSVKSNKLHNKKELILGSRKLPLSYLLTQESTSKNLSGE